MTIEKAQRVAAVQWPSSPFHSYCENKMQAIIANGLLAATLGTSMGYPATQNFLAGRELILIDTRTYRHCHNDRGRYTVCFKKDPRDRQPEDANR